MTLSDVVARLHGRSRATELPLSDLPHSLVTVLDDGAELRAAIDRAMTFERSIASRAGEQIARYEQMTAPSVVVGMPTPEHHSTDPSPNELREPA